MSVDAVYQDLRARLHDVVPDVELRIKAEWVDEINRLKTERCAVILAHNYMEPALFHSIPDFTGDSLSLCRQAAETDAEVIVFCGVRFMAETAKILNPDKKVLLPAEDAGCSLASGITAADVRELRRAYPGAPVVAYVNTDAAVKAEVDICCTSGNAAQVVRSLDADEVIFLPDEFLARNVARELGWSFNLPEDDREPTVPRIIGWPAHCEVHEKFTVQDVDDVRKQFPGVVVLAHPECRPEVVAAADYSGSTARMIRYVERSADSPILLLTECAMGDNISAGSPDKDLLRLCSVRCPHMNRITLEDTLHSLRHDRYQIEVPDEIRVPAARSVRRMLEMSGAVAHRGARLQR